MKLHTFAIITIFLISSLGAQAEPKAVEKIIDTLHQALKSPEPLPLLHKAKEELQKYHAASSGLGLGPKARGAVRGEAVERKQESMERLEKAIAEAKAGRDPKAKIEATIADVRNMAALKR